MNRVNLTKEQCCGCGACRNRCPKHAITMQADAEGFGYPVIDDALCVDCGLCVKACPACHEKDTPAYEQQYFAAQHTDDTTVMNSSSGGVFSALADATLAQNGVVYGAAFDEQFRVHHTRAETREQAAAFRGSKYVQSDIGDTMQAVAGDLKDGRAVLFSGTPCQTDGLKRYLQAAGVSTDTLLLCDFVCHGVPSPLVWQSYVTHLQGTYGSLDFFSFRGKADGWHQYFPTILAGGQDVSRAHRTKNSYFLLYSTCNITRPSCYACRYTSYERVSDITVADFWNIDKAVPEMDDDRGTSQVIINTPKGQQWFERITDAVRQKSCTKENVWQPHLEYPIKRPKSRERFWQAYKALPFEQVIQQYGQDPLMIKCRKAVMPLINKLGLYVLAGKLYRLVFVRKK